MCERIVSLITRICNSSAATLRYTFWALIERGIRHICILSTNFTSKFWGAKILYLNVYQIQANYSYGRVSYYSFLMNGSWWGLFCIHLEAKRLILPMGALCCWCLRVTQPSLHPAPQTPPNELLWCTIFQVPHLIELLYSTLYPENHSECSWSSVPYHYLYDLHCITVSEQLGVKSMECVGCDG